MDDLFGDQEIDFECSECNQVFQVKFKEVKEDNSMIQCPHCGSTIIVKHEETTKNTLRDSKQALNKVNKQFDKLEKAFKKFK